jgi:hypothetical protein
LGALLGRVGETISPDEKFLVRVAALLQGGAEGPGAVVASGTASVENYPRTKVGFSSWAKDKFNLTPTDLGMLFTNAGIVFDLSRWDDLKKLVEEKSNGVPV